MELQVLICLGIFDAGLVVGIVVHIHILREEVRGGPGPVAQVRLHSGVVISRKGGRHCEHADDGQRQHHAERVDQPSAAQALDLDQRLDLPYNFLAGASLRCVKNK